MAITVTESWSNNRAEADSGGRKAWRTFQVTGTADPFMALEHADIPALNSAHPTKANLYVFRRGTPQREGPQFFTIEVEYRTGTQVGIGNDDDPINQAPTYTWNVALASEPVEQDIDGNPIVNSAGDSFAQTLSVTTHSITLDVERNEASFDPVFALDYVNKVNLGAWTIAGKTVGEGQAKCMGIAPTSGYTLQDSYVRVRYSFEFRREGFKVRVLDQGRRAVCTPIANTSGDAIEVKDIKVGNEAPEESVSTECLLDGVGTPTTPGVIPPSGFAFYPFGGSPAGAELQTNDHATYLIYKVYEAVDFSGMQLS